MSETEAAPDANKIVGFSGVLAVAVVSRDFCALLLSNPQAALKEGYMGKSFALTPDESIYLESIRVNNLPEFAQKILEFKPPTPRTTP